jgi:Flp pilus assembly protein TadD
MKVLPTGRDYMNLVKKNWSALLYAMLLSAAVLLVYGLGLQNEFIFDDARIADGSMFKAFGNLFEFKLRMLSYGSFSWIHAIAGANVAAQRVGNVLLHLGTCWALYQLFALLLTRILYAEATRAEPGFAASQVAALRVGILVYALHPVAAYAVGYLIQRSIVMATLFGVLACWAFVRGVTERKWLWHTVALLFYLMAVLSKQQVAFIAGLTFPLYIFLTRPNRARVVLIVAVAFTLLCIALTGIQQLFPHLVARIIDPESLALAGQLERQRPGALGQIYALSVLNEAALFFYYGALWMLPYVGWMSIDMHPPFPLTLTTIPHVVGAMAYLALLIAAVVAVIRRNDVWGFVGLCLLFPLILFWTEFSTVWVQDPFVLYRSYLWAIPIPALVAVLLTGFSPGALYKMASILALVLGISTVDRVSSMQNALVVWADVMDKVTVPGAPNAVGRSRAFMNHGMERLKRFEFDLAMKDFSAAHKLGAIKGEALFAMGMTRRAKGDPVGALQLLQQAESAGYTDGRLHFQRAQAFAALGSVTEAIQSYTQSLALPSAGNYEEAARADRADLAMRLSRFEDAKVDFEWLLTRSPKQTRYLMGLGLAQLGLKNATGALQTFNALMLEKPDALAYYGRALSQHQLGNKVAALEDIGKAVQMEPSNAVYKQVQESIKKGEKLSL